MSFCFSLKYQTINKIASQQSCIGPSGNAYVKCHGLCLEYSTWNSRTLLIHRFETDNIHYGSIVAPLKRDQKYSKKHKHTQTQA